MGQVQNKGFIEDHDKYKEGEHIDEREEGSEEETESEEEEIVREEVKKETEFEINEVEEEIRKESEIKKKKEGQEKDIRRVSLKVSTKSTLLSRAPTSPTSHRLGLYNFPAVPLSAEKAMNGVGNESEGSGEPHKSEPHSHNGEGQPRHSCPNCACWSSNQSVSNSVPQPPAPGPVKWFPTEAKVPLTVRMGNPGPPTGGEDNKVEFGRHATSAFFSSGAQASVPGVWTGGFFQAAGKDANGGVFVGAPKPFSSVPTSQQSSNGVTPSMIPSFAPAGPGAHNIPSSSISQSGFGPVSPTKRGEFFTSPPPPPFTGPPPPPRNDNTFTLPNGNTYFLQPPLPGQYRIGPDGQIIPLPPGGTPVTTGTFHKPIKPLPKKKIRPGHSPSPSRNPTHINPNANVGVNNLSWTGVVTRSGLDDSEDEDKKIVGGGKTKKRALPGSVLGDNDHSTMSNHGKYGVGHPVSASNVSVGGFTPTSTLFQTFGTALHQPPPPTPTLDFSIPLVDPILSDSSKYDISDPVVVHVYDGTTPQGNPLLESDVEKEEEEIDYGDVREIRDLPDLVDDGLNSNSTSNTPTPTITTTTTTTTMTMTKGKKKKKKKGGSSTSQQGQEHPPVLASKDGSTTKDGKEEKQQQQEPKTPLDKISKPVIPYRYRKNRYRDAVGNGDWVCFFCEFEQVFGGRVWRRGRGRGKERKEGEVGEKRGG